MHLLRRISSVLQGSTHEPPWQSSFMNLIFIVRERWETACTVYSLAIYLLAAVLDGRCSLRLNSALKLCKYLRLK